MIPCSAMQLAQRAQRLAESATLRVTQRAADLRAEGRAIISFGAGEPDFPSPPVAVEAARHALADGFTRYTAAAGIPSLRQALAQRFADQYGAPWALANTMVTVGAKAALFELFLTLVDDGDEVIMPTPCWVSFEEHVRFAGGNAVLVERSWEDRFAIHAEPIIEAMTERTRVVLLNSPCNPSGGLVGADDLRRIVEACAERGIILLSDETYERFVYDGGTHVSAAEHARSHPETVVVVGSFSKTYSMTGWRVGYALGPATLIKKVIDIQSHATSNPTSFAMVGAQAALEHAESEVQTMIAAFEQRRDLVVERLQAMPGIRCTSPGGAFYVLPDVSACFRPDRHGSIALAEFLLEEAEVAVVPGIAFGNDNHIRISFACSRDDLETGLARMARALAP